MLKYIETHTSATIVSAIFSTKLSVGFKPSHFRLFFFFDLPLPPVQSDCATVLSPARPSQTRPSAVPAAITPEGEIAVDIMKGGGADIPGPRAGAGARQRSQQQLIALQKEEKEDRLMSKRDRSVPCLKSKCSRAQSYPPETSSFGRSGMNEMVYAIYADNLGVSECTLLSDMKLKANRGMGGLHSHNAHS